MTDDELSMMREIISNAGRFELTELQRETEEVDRHLEEHSQLGWTMKSRHRSDPSPESQGYDRQSLYLV